MLPEQIEDAKKRQVEEIQRRVRRSAAFQRMFLDNPDGDIVLKEIEFFCKGNTLVIRADSTQTQILTDTAKKDVWQFIRNCIDVDVEKVQKELEAIQNAQNKTT
jgi:hypothetical protein